MVEALFFHLSPKFDTWFEIVWFAALLGKPFFLWILRFDPIAFNFELYSSLDTTLQLVTIITF